MPRSHNVLADPKLGSSISQLAGAAFGVHPDMQIKGAQMQQQVLLNQEQTAIAARKNAAAKIIDDAFAAGVAIETPGGGVRIDPKQANNLIHAVMKADPTANISPLLDAINKQHDADLKQHNALQTQNNEVIKVTPGEKVGTRASLGIGQDNGDGVNLNQDLPVGDGPPPVSGLTGAATGSNVGGVYTNPAKDTSKPIPANINTGIINNINSIKEIDKVLQELDRHPNAVGFQNKIPIVGNPLVMNNLIDPDGTMARAGIANIGSLKMHDRYGSRQTVTEITNLAPYIPQPGDTKEIIKRKLNGLKDEFNNVLTDTQATYTPDGGYKPNPLLDDFLKRRAAGESSTPPTNAPTPPSQSGLAGAATGRPSPSPSPIPVMKAIPVAQPTATPTMTPTQHGTIVEPALPEADPVPSPAVPAASPLAKAAIGNLVKPQAPSGIAGHPADSPGVAAPMKLDANTHGDILGNFIQQANGDVNKARQLATEQGYSF